MGAIHTGIFNKEIVSEALRRSAIVQRKCLADVALEEFQNWIDLEAVKAGLPTPEKDKDGNVIHYGLLGSGEFTKWNGES